MLADMDETLTLSDGTRLAVREIRSEDAEKLRVGFHALSPTTRYQRFMGQLADLTPTMLEYLTCVDGVDHIALVALLLDPEERERELVAVARAIRLEPGSATAEIAITVGDPLQRQGLGRALLQALVERAKQHGVQTLVAHALPSNRAIRRLLHTYGAVTETSEERLRVSLAPNDGALTTWARKLSSALPLRTITRAA